MGTETKIQWTDHTFNPWWGCVRVSPGCQHCYAETFAKRTGHAVWGVEAPRRYFGQKHWDEPLKWHAAAVKAGERRRVFCASMADVFEGRSDQQPYREKLWALIEATPLLDWLLLTKRPEHIAGLIPARWLDAPRQNVWYGTTVEDRARQGRVAAIAAVPAWVRFLSCEPLLEAIEPDLLLIDWVIVGGESGPGARPFDLEWARSLVRQCRDAGVACFVKQLGADPYEAYSDGSRFSDVKLNDRKGGDINEWSAELCVRQFPLAKAEGGPR